MIISHLGLYLIFLLFISLLGYYSGGLLANLGFVFDEFNGNWVNFEHYDDSWWCFVYSKVSY